MRRADDSLQVEFAGLGRDGEARHEQQPFPAPALRPERDPRERDPRERERPSDDSGPPQRHAEQDRGQQQDIGAMRAHIEPEQESDQEEDPDRVFLTGDVPPLEERPQDERREQRGQEHRE